MSNEPVEVRVTNEAAATGIGVFFGTIGLFACFALIAMLVALVAVVVVPVLLVGVIVWVFIRTGRLNLAYREELERLGWDDPRENGRRFR